MKAFIWNDYYLTHLPSVDEQHHLLVDLINELSELMMQGFDFNSDTIQGIFKRLTDYAVYHFDNEETLMQEVKIDERHFLEHHLEHGRFMLEVGELLETAESGSQSSLDDLLKFLTHWLAYHILRQDKEMSKQVSLIEKGVSPADAYDQVKQEVDSATEPLLLALNGLFDQVSRRNKELKELNRTLEQKVRSRTEALTDLNEHLQKIANTDQLTELPNRRYAMSFLQQAIKDHHQASKVLSCIMIDVDGFKQINDQHGHVFGDYVLSEMARHLKNSFRNDDLVARLGGDEFMVVLPDTDLEGAQHIAEKARKSVSEMSVNVNDETWKGSISMGVACTNDVINDYTELLKAADSAVYEAKRHGKNRVCKYS